MDCEKFDEHVIDALYDELDELTAAALKRHTDGCARCAAILAGLKATREGASLALEEPSADLEARIMDAERAAQKTAPVTAKVMRAAAWAGSHAMRPQLAMAALFMLVVGSSLLLLRARPGTVGAPVEVTERGEPSPAAPSAPEGAAKRSAGRGQEMPGSQGLEQKEEMRVGGKADSDRNEADKGMAKAAEAAAPAATAEAGAAAASPPPAAPSDAKDKAKDSLDSPELALSKARDARAKGGCTEALGRLEDVSRRFPSSPEAAIASREAGDCQREVAMAPAAKPAAAAKEPAKAKPAASSTGKPGGGN